MSEPVNRIQANFDLEELEVTEDGRIILRDEDLAREIRGSRVEGGNAPTVDINIGPFCGGRVNARRC